MLIVNSHDEIHSTWVKSVIFFSIYKPSYKNALYQNRSKQAYASVLSFPTFKLHSDENET